MDFDPYTIIYYAYSYILSLLDRRYPSSPCGYLMGRIDLTSAKLVFGEGYQSINYHRTASFIATRYFISAIVLQTD
jgi:hypothetical protein